MELERALERARAGARRLGSMSLEERIALIDALRRDVAHEAESWVATSCKAKGLDPASTRAAEEWLNGPMSVLRNLRLLRKTLASLSARGLHGKGAQGRGRKEVLVMPRSLEDRLFFFGFRARVLMQPDGSENGSTRNPLETEPGVAALLSAGNVSSIGPQDFLSLLFARNRACVLKTNPVNEVLVPHWERAFQAALDLDLLQIVVGDAELGAALVQHPDVDEVHMTGSAETYDRIVWGGPEVCEENRAANRPVLHKPISAELGCVTPVIIAPGLWSKRDLRSQAMNVASMLVNNASFNCVAAKVLVTSADWPQRKEFLGLLAETLAGIAPRKAYYPGAADRHRAFCAAFPEVQLLGESCGDNLPWALVTGLDPEENNPLAFQQEAWCGVLAETALPGEDATEFLPRAVEFCNRRLFGTLSCTLIIDPGSASAHRASLDGAIRDLGYGTIAVNHWTGVAYALGTIPWGAHPGHTPARIESGVGFVHNTDLLQGVLKSILQGPFRPLVKPVWFANHRRALAVARALTRYEARPGAAALLAVLFAGMRG